MRIRRGSSQDAPDLHRRMESLLNALLHDLPAGRQAASAWVPRADIYETRAGFVVLLELPGIDRDELDIVVEGMYLSVSGRRTEPTPGSCVRWHHMEIAHGRFERVIALPEAADADRITAFYRDGFLEIVIPRGGSASRNVPIETG